MRQEAEDRLRLQSNEIKRFHEKICARVTERERQNRLEAQRSQKHLDAKYAKLFSTTKSIQPPENPSIQSSARPHFQKLKENKRALNAVRVLRHFCFQAYR
ncbi:hypothetical protein PHPALM_416 [Phytophthora palmivora]|uniref:Uncharacterized protein n=1 Tax=Phytophthora palmivora TaxID=4796 RepID=A0A2P4YUZ0_9STRA|nr:hypothetical protein PHPALM_416 [Phytophthora palmivora]